MRDSIFAQFLTRPLTTGAVLPSSPELSRAMTADIDIESARTVVELGPGTGAVTGFIAESISPEASFFAVELNPAVIKALKKRHPKVKVYHDCASNLPHLLRKEGRETVDIVLSGLPWASFSDAVQEEILGAIVSTMPEGGVFATFAYLQGTLLPSGVNFKKRLHKYFRSVEKSQVVWLNIPPAFIYRCRK